MNEPPGAASALGIEAVEWLAEGGDNLTVRVMGRWRRRRPAWSAQPTLVIEGPGRRYRFPAIAEPPSLTGAGPGTWRISFAVPAALAPELGGRSWLQFGAVVVPLPAAVRPPDLGGEESSPAAGPAAPSALPHPAPSALPHPAPSAPPPGEQRSSEAVPGPAAAELVALKAELEEARAEVTRLSAVLADEQLARRAAEQGARAERSLRADLTRQLRLRTAEAEGARDALNALARAEQRVRELEGELGHAHERGRSAEEGIAAATAGREAAERELAATRVEAERKEAAAAHERAPGAGEPPPPAQQRHLSFEQQLIARRGAPSRIPAEPLRLIGAPTPARPAGAAAGLAASEGARAMTEALRHELTGRALAEAGLRSRLIEAEARLAARQLLEQRTNAVLTQLREELGGLREDLERERAARRAAEARSERLRSNLGGARTGTQEAREAIAEIRGALESLRAPVDPDAPEPEGQPAEPVTPANDPDPDPDPRARGRSSAGRSTSTTPVGAVEPERLSQALQRLREQIAPQEAAPSAPAQPPTFQPDPSGQPRAPFQPDPPGQPRATFQPDAPGQPPAAPQSDPPAQLPAAPQSDPPAQPTATVQPDPAVDLGPLTVGRPWLREAFRSLARADPDRAGRLLVDLLPAQRSVYPHPVAYDLELGGEWGCLRVTIRDGRQQILSSDAPRSPGDVDFRFTGEPADLARLLRAGRLRRRFGRRVGRVRGRRAGLAGLDALVGTQLGLGALHASGVRLDPRSALALLARLISPAWAEGERFSLAYGEPGEDPVYLLVDGRRPVEVTENRPGAPASTTVTGPAGTLELLLREDAAAAGALTGDPRPIQLLRQWVKRAQSG
jgi:hypothetical protein